MTTTKRILIGIPAFFLIIILSFLLYIKYSSVINPPKVNLSKYSSLKVDTLAEDFFISGNNWLRKNESGLWELYVEGNPAERGSFIGLLTSNLIKKQEESFVSQLRKMISSDFYISFLKYFVAWFNRNTDKYIAREYLEEIYAISRYASDDYDFIGEKYDRILNYHAAHDIGHALQNMNMVGCTSFSVWGTKSRDGSIITGRNFDFYINDEFAKDKIIMLCKPEKGYKFAMVTWGGMIGAVSGMNERGLTVTLNAAKSGIPMGAKTPISILAREILQYSRNINEAYRIASKRQTFVSEAIMISSGYDNKTAIIEKTPEKTVLYISPDNYIICSNHFQSEAFRKDHLNIANIAESSSMYRYQRTFELISHKKKIDASTAAEILRDQQGLNDKDIGMSNEKALNQLIAHHSVIFNPTKRLMWVSTNPYQLGQYICYDLNRVFTLSQTLKSNNGISSKEMSIKEDPFLDNGGYDIFLKYKKLKNEITDCIKDKDFRLHQNDIEDFISLNPEYFGSYSLAGDYYSEAGQKALSERYYKQALTKEIPTKQDIEKITEKINNLKK